MAFVNNCLTVVLAVAAVARISATQIWSRAAMQDQAQQLTMYTPDAAMDTLHSLDTNSDGQVDFSEVAAFAKAKGLDYTGTLQEFSNFDADHNGLLDAREVAEALQTSTSAEQQQQLAAETRETSPSAEQQQQPAADTRETAPFVEQLQQQQQQRQQQQQQPAAPVNGESVFSVSAGRNSTATESFPAGLAVHAVTGYNAEAQQALLAKVSAALSQEVTAEHDAAASEAETAKRRSRLATLRGSVEEEAQESGQTAAKAKAEEIVHTLQLIEENATRMEVAAAAIHAKNKAEMQYAELLSSAASEAFSGSQAAKQA